MVFLQNAYFSKIGSYVLLSFLILVIWVFFFLDYSSKFLSILLMIPKNQPFVNIHTILLCLQNRLTWPESSPPKVTSRFLNPVVNFQPLFGWTSWKHQVFVPFWTRLLPWFLPATFSWQLFPHQVPSQSIHQFCLYPSVPVAISQGFFLWVKKIFILENSLWWTYPLYASYLLMISRSLSLFSWTWTRISTSYWTYLMNMYSVAGIVLDASDTEWSNTHTKGPMKPQGRRGGQSDNDVRKTQSDSSSLPLNMEEGSWTKKYRWSLESWKQVYSWSPQNECMILAYLRQLSFRLLTSRTVIV